MRRVFADTAWDDCLHWQKHDRRMAERINRLIQEVLREPFAGVGKPEPLRHALSGFWSRRITDEHRMVYSVDAEDLLIAQLQYHYRASRPIRSRGAAAEPALRAAGEVSPAPPPESEIPE